MKAKIFTIAMLLISVLLFMLRLTGLPLHIILSVVGVVLLVVFAILTKKEWKKPILEIILRVLFAIAFITGILAMNLVGVAAVAIIHKISAVLFALMLVVLYAPKLFR